MPSTPDCALLIAPASHVGSGAKVVFSSRVLPALHGPCPVGPHHPDPNLKRLPLTLNHKRTLLQPLPAAMAATRRMVPNPRLTLQLMARPPSSKRTESQTATRPTVTVEVTSRCKTHLVWRITLQSPNPSPPTNCACDGGRLLLQPLERLPLDVTPLALVGFISYFYVHAHWIDAMVGA